MAGSVPSTGPVAFLRSASGHLFNGPPAATIISAAFEELPYAAVEVQPRRPPGMIERPPMYRVTAALLGLAGLAAGCSTRPAPAATSPPQRHWSSTSQPSPADDFLAAEVGNLAADDQLRSAQSADRPPKARHRDMPLRPPRRAR